MAPALKQRAHPAKNNLILASVFPSPRTQGCPRTSTTRVPRPTDSLPVLPPAVIAHELAWPAWFIPGQPVPATLRISLPPSRLASLRCGSVAVVLLTRPASAPVLAHGGHDTHPGHGRQRVLALRIWVRRPGIRYCPMLPALSPRSPFSSRPLLALASSSLAPTVINAKAAVIFDSEQLQISCGID